MLGNIQGVGKSSWQDNLMKDITLAPLFLFFIWVILGIANTHFLDTLANKSSDADFTKTLIMIAVEAMVILGMLTAAKKIAMDRASYFGGQLNAVLSKGLNFVVGSQIGMAAGAAGAIGQATLGRYGANVANSDELKKKRMREDYLVRGHDSSLGQVRNCRPIALISVKQRQCKV